MPKKPEEKLTEHLTDVHSIEEQALLQMKVAPRLAGDPQLARDFQRHRIETQDHARRVRARLRARGAEPSRTKDLVAQAGAVGMVAFARSQRGTPGKLVAHAYAFENMEVAAYDLLGLAAERAGDSETVALARSIGEQETEMARRLEDGFDRAVEASLRGVAAAELDDQLNRYLRDVHALETEAIQLLELAPGLVGRSRFVRVLDAHLEATKSHQEWVRERLHARGGRPSRFRDRALRGGGLNLGGFFGAQPDTPAKLAGFAFAFEHLEIAAYDQLRRLAESAGDVLTAGLARQIGREERAAAAAIRAQFPALVDTTYNESSAFA